MRNHPARGETAGERRADHGTYEGRGPVTDKSRAQRSARAPEEGLPMTALDRRDPRLHSWIILMHGRDKSDPLFLHVKEAEASVLSRYCGASQYANQGQRVIASQAADAAVQRHLPGLAADRGRARQAATRHLCPAAPRLASGADGRWREHTPAPETASLSPPTWAAPTCSTRPSPSSPPPAPTRPSATAKTLAVASGRITAERDI
jgi:hypothetical protein